MKALRLSEVRELLQGATFAAWWSDHARAVADLRDATARHDDLVVHSELMEVRSEVAQRAAVRAFSRAGEAEADATKALAEGQALENRALELVGHFEAQRRRTSELWVRVGASKRAHQRELRHEHATEDAKRARLSEDLEAAWAASFERALLAAERRQHAGRLRRDAERSFQEADERRSRAKRLRADAEAAAREVADGEERRAELLVTAARELGCVAGGAFLYWRHPDDAQLALAVALADDPDGANVPVKALEIYAVGRDRGAASLEPARDAVPSQDGERHLADHLLGPARAARPKLEGEPPPGGAPKP